eukprot:Nitzschia sp. Nitz4//scaffold45_size130396//39993//41507//NITZ4_003442-RA/size130396-processed-gene-0.181-mRNA-1//1//CDS//3329552377//1190//frame0
MVANSLNPFGDIVCGRGCGQLSWGPANLRFKRLLASTLWMYDQADKDKRILCTVIVRFILDRGGRFVVAPVEAIREQKAAALASRTSNTKVSNRCSRDMTKVLRERREMLSTKFKRSKLDVQEMSMDKSIDKVGQTFRDLRTLRDKSCLRFDLACPDEKLQLTTLHKLIADQVHRIDLTNSPQYSPGPKSAATRKVTPKRKHAARKRISKKVTTPSSCASKTGNQVGIKRPRGKRLTPRPKAQRQVPPRVSPMQTPRRVSLPPMDNIEKHTTQPSTFLTIVPVSSTASTCRSVTPIAGVLAQSSEGSRTTPLSDLGQEGEGSGSSYLDLISPTTPTESLISDYLQPTPRRVSLLATTPSTRDSHATSPRSTTTTIEMIPDDFWDLEDDRPSSSIHPNLIVPVSPIKQQPRVVNMDPLFFLKGNHAGVVVQPQPGSPATKSGKDSCTEDDRGGQSTSTATASNDNTVLCVLKQEKDGLNDIGFTPTFWEVCMPTGGAGQQIRGIF